jgi:hypothetical protein
MRCLFGFAVILLSVSYVPASAEDCAHDLPPLVELIEEYSQASGVNFILDPRVSARVSIVGRDTLFIDSATLLGILRVHGFEAYEANGVVYVVPETSGNVIGAELGQPWKG